MIVHSFIEQRNQLIPVEVEVSLSPGLPGLQFLGRADTSIKESEARIRSALLHQGFELPGAREILINLRPSHLKKTSKGLDLAVAAAILWETRQLIPPVETPVFLYGELSLTGEVLAPDDSEFIPAEELRTPLITGSNSALSMTRREIKSLAELREPLTVTVAAPSIQRPSRPPLKSLKFPKSQADLLMVVATGEHSAILAGPSGSGKTTCAQQVISLLKEPEGPTWQEIQNLARSSSDTADWRPFCSPHHSTPPLSMIGGGSPPQPGEISRAHGGVLLLDELLEFRPVVLEALREPIELGQMSVSRLGSFITYPANFLLLATTNLCPCSKYIPGRKNRCRCRIRQRRSYLQRLSGPVLDRFQIFALVENEDLFSNSDYVTLDQILERVLEAQDHARSSRGQEGVNSKLSLEDLEQLEDPFLLRNLLPETGDSHRRKQALLQVARTLADLDLEEKIRPRHLQNASRLTLYGFQQLEEAD